MKLDDPRKYCFMIRNGQSCVKNQVAKEHLPYYECEKCVWRIQSEDPKYLKSLQRIYEKYGNKTWNY
ncbi:MAG: hypothetical protein EU532_02845 [Promethearchaeota archaeon]|nr:MAG: hypothetical protein EU532_02845 [Candidatus Lokiarchaeota archaeon]